jgi:hypothetical protein
MRPSDILMPPIWAALLLLCMTARLHRAMVPR